MPSQRAVAQLKETLSQQYGAGAREVVEAEVEGRLAGRSKLEREDLDAIEHSVVAALRQRRGGGQRRSRTRSTPDLAATAASDAPTAPPVPVPAPPGVSFGALGPRVRSTSETKLRPPPFGVTITDTSDTESIRSRVRFCPKNPVPLRPKLKALDHWDLIVAFDTAKHRSEQEAHRRQGKHGRFKATLDDQMHEVLDLREQEAGRRRQERADMLAQLEENKRVQAREQEALEGKRALQKKSNDEAVASLRQRDQKVREKKQHDQDQMTRWLANEKDRQQEERRANAEEYARKCQLAREEQAAIRAEAARRKKAEQDYDIAIAAGQVAEMDNRQAANKAAVQERMDQIERNCATLGAEIAGRDARLERELQAKIRRTQEEADIRSKEDAERRQTERQGKVQNMLDTLAEQMNQREEDRKVEKDANRKQAEIWKQQREESEHKERERVANVRKKREDLDQELLRQIRNTASVHPLNFGITAQTQQIDTAYNRLLYEQMAGESFREDMAAPILGKASHRKLDPFPSVGRYEQPIHPLEMEAAPATVPGISA